MTEYFATRSRWLPLLLLVALTLLLTWPLPLNLATHSVDRQDPLLNSWIMAWEARQLLLDPRALYDANIFFPQGNALAFSETLFSVTALILPVHYAFDNALLSHNLAFLLVFFTTALGGYLLALYLTGHRGAALVAALAFAWAPYRIGQISQVQLLAFGWLPLAMIYLDRLLRSTTTGRRWWRDLLLFTFFLLLQALASFYSALFSAAACVLYAAGWGLWRGRLSPKAVAAGGMAALAVGAVLIVVAQPYFEVQRTLGAGWSRALNEQFSASLQSYRYAPALTHFWGPLTADNYYTHGLCCPPSSLFPGLTLVVLALVALLWGRGGRRWLWLLIGLSGLLLSFGPTFTMVANEPTTWPLPYRLLLDHLPGFDAIRAPVRWAVLLTLALAVLSAIALARLRRWWWSLLAFALLLVEFSPAPLRLIEAPAPFPALAWLDEQPPTRIVELPLVAERPTATADSPRQAWEQSRLLEAQFFSTQHWHTTPDGYSGYVPTRHGDFAREMRPFPSERSARLLRGLGVRYVVIHEADLNVEQMARMAAPLPAGVVELTRIGSDRILAVGPLVSTRPSEQLPLTTLPANQRVTVPLILRPTTVYVPLSRGPLAVIVRWTGANGVSPLAEQRVSVPLPLITEWVAPLPVLIDTPPAGDWTLTVSGTLPPNDPFELSQQVVVSEEAGPPPTLLPVALDEVTWEGETVALHWRSDGPLPRYYSVVVQRVDSDGAVLAEAQGAPDGNVGTLLWQPGERYGSSWTLPLPDGVEAAQTTLRLRWVDPETNDELWLWDGEAFAPTLQR